MQSAEGPVMGCCEHGNETSAEQAEQLSVFQE